MKGTIKMKILWLCNIILPDFCECFDLNKTMVGGWISGMLQELEKREDMQIALCFPIIDENRVKQGRFHGHQFFSFQCDLYSDDYIYADENLIIQMQKIVSDYEPDIIHIWGTEYPHTYGMVEACKREGLLNRVVINIQGLVSIYSKHFLLGIPQRYITKMDVEGTSLAQKKNLFVKRGILETKAIKNVKYVIGRTEWDRACTYWINPQIHYFFGGEILRSVFYENCGSWKEESCRRHMIFVSQGDYSIKGMHFLLEGCKLLRQKYADLQIIVAGKNIFCAGELTTYAQLLKELMREGDLEGQVQFVGKKDESQMCQYYQQANVFVMPSVIENSPNSLCEALMTGVPVVAANVGGISSIIRHGKEGFLYQSDAPYMMAYYIDLIFARKIDIELLKVNEVNRAMEFNSVYKCSEQTVAAYHIIEKG